MLRLRSHEQKSTLASMLQKLTSANLNVKNKIDLNFKLQYGDLLKLQSHEQESTRASWLQKLSRANLNVKDTIYLNIKLK